MEKLPFVSVIILNYFGEKVINNVLETLENLNYPKDSYEVIVVDNASTDKSREILKRWQEKSENNKLVLNNKNLGFSKGNNVGIKNAKGDYVVLLNNDCIVESNWLKELVKTAQNHPKVFAVNSKILLYPKYFNLKFTIDPHLIPQYSWVSNSRLYDFTDKKLYLNLASNGPDYMSEVVFDPIHDLEIEVSLVFNHGSDFKVKNLKGLITFQATGVEVIDCSSAKNEVSYKVKIDLKNQSLKKYTFSKIQNAGIMPFQNGYARDIGGVVKESRHLFEQDDGQYDKEVEVYAACGAAMLMSKSVLNRIGLLDETFFMYYEDVEISERARLNGYKIYYSPNAVVRHIHALSSKEGSNFFAYHVEKGRLLHMFFNFPFTVFLAEYFRSGFLTFFGIVKVLLRIRSIRALSKKSGNDQPIYRAKIQKIYVLTFFITRLPFLLLKRHQKNASLPEKSVADNYNEILSGRWYFK